MNRNMRLGRQKSAGLVGLGLSGLFGARRDHVIITRPLNPEP